jgi:hypothetical protein
MDYLHFNGNSNVQGLPCQNEVVNGALVASNATNAHMSVGQSHASNNDNLYSSQSNGYYTGNNQYYQSQSNLAPRAAQSTQQTSNVQNVMYSTQQPVYNNNVYSQPNNQYCYNQFSSQSTTIQTAPSTMVTTTSTLTSTTTSTWPAASTDYMYNQQQYSTTVYNGNYQKQQFNGNSGMYQDPAVTQGIMKPNDNQYKAYPGPYQTIDASANHMIQSTVNLNTGASTPQKFNPNQIVNSAGN